MEANRIRWGRIVIGGALIEVLLLVLAVPLLTYLDNPFAAAAGQAEAAGAYTTFFVVITIACFGAGALGGAWVARPIASQMALHGALAGVIATAIYLAICSIPPTTIAAVMAAYGPFWFLLANGLRIVGGAVGALLAARRRR